MKRAILLTECIAINSMTQAVDLTFKTECFAFCKYPIVSTQIKQKLLYHIYGKIV